MNKNATLVVRISQENKNVLEQLAQDMGISMSSLVRPAIDHFIKSKKIKSKKKKNEDQELLDDLLKIAKKLKKTNAPKDLSTTYKDYLYGDKSKWARRR